MPNHVENDLRINGKITDIQKFFAEVEDKENNIPIDHHKIIPYPKEFKDLDEKSDRAEGFNSGGYEWCVQNWGTKWGMYGFSQVVWTKSSAKVSFDSAWNPPKPLIIKLGEMFPELTFTLKYYECGCEFKGVLKVKGNQILEDKTETYHGTRGG